MYGKKFISVTSHALDPTLPLSQTVTPSRSGVPRNFRQGARIHYPAFHVLVPN